jgi:hypothetical protein
VPFLKAMFCSLDAIDLLEMEDCLTHGHSETWEKTFTEYDLK